MEFPEVGGWSGEARAFHPRAPGLLAVETNGSMLIMAGSTVILSLVEDLEGEIKRQGSIFGGLRSMERGERKSEMGCTKKDLTKIEDVSMIFSGIT